MRRALAGMVIPVFLLSACGGEDEKESIPTASNPVDRDEKFADTMRQYAPTLSDATTSDLIALAEVICESFDNGMSFESAMTTLAESGAEGDGPVIIGGSVAYACPEHENKF
jgi:hypothetical protein